MAMPIQVTGEKSLVKVDDYTRSILAINPRHNDLHEGRQYFFYNSENVGSGNSMSLSFTTPNNVTLSFLTCIDTENTANVSIYEDVTTQNGTPVTPLNASRQHHNETQTSNVVKNATVNTVNAVALVENLQIGFSNRNRWLLPGKFDGHREWILKRNTRYSVIVENTSGTDNKILICSDWIEGVF